MDIKNDTPLSNLDFTTYSALLFRYTMNLFDELQKSEETIILEIRKKWAKPILNDDDTPPLLNQASFIAYAYICLVWLWENIRIENFDSYLNNQNASEILNEIKIVNQGKCRRLDGINDYLRLVRNALSHGKVKIKSQTFIFHDENPKKQNDYGTIEMQWAQLAKLSSFVLDYSIFQMKILHKI